MLSERLENTLRNAFEIAGNNRHAYATLEHLLLALLDDEDANEVLVSCDVDLKELRSVLIDFINNELSSLKVKNFSEVKPTASFQRVIQRAVHHVQHSGNGKATGANILVAIFSERESHAVFYLHEQQVTRLAAVTFISHGSTKMAKINIAEDQSINDQGTKEKNKRLDLS